MCCNALQCFASVFIWSHLWHERSIQIHPTGMVRCPSSHCFASSSLVYTQCLGKDNRVRPWFYPSKAHLMRWEPLLFHAPFWQFILSRSERCSIFCSCYGWTGRHLWRRSGWKLSAFLTHPFTWTTNSACDIRKHWHEFISVLNPLQQLSFRELQGTYLLTHLFGVFIQVKLWRQHPHPHPPSSLAGLTFRLTVDLFPSNNTVHYKHDMTRCMESISTSWKNLSVWKPKTRCSSMYHKL